MSDLSQMLDAMAAVIWREAGGSGKTPAYTVAGGRAGIRGGAPAKAAHDLRNLYEDGNEKSLEEMNEADAATGLLSPRGFGRLLAEAALGVGPKRHLESLGIIVPRFKVRLEGDELVWDGDVGGDFHVSRGSNDDEQVNPDEDDDLGINPARRSEWGFDLTDFKPGGWSKVLCELGIDPDPTTRRLYSGDPQMSGKYRSFVWSGRGIEIVTSNNPITGESGRLDNHNVQENFAGYIGIRGTQAKVREAKSLIKRYAKYIKDDRGSRGLQYIDFEENPHDDWKNAHGLTYREWLRQSGQRDSPVRFSAWRRGEHPRDYANQ